MNDVPMQTTNCFPILFPHEMTSSLCVQKNWWLPVTWLPVHVTYGHVTSDHVTSGHMTSGHVTSDGNIRGRKFWNIAWADPHTKTDLKRQFQILRFIMLLESLCEKKWTDLQSTVIWLGVLMGMLDLAPCSQVIWQIAIKESCVTASLISAGYILCISLRHQIPIYEIFRYWFMAPNEPEFRTNPAAAAAVTKDHLSRIWRRALNELESDNK